MDKTLLYQHAFDKDVVRRTATPFYYYDTALLHETLQEVNHQIHGLPFKVHYAVKANNNPRILSEIAKGGLGADLVSGGEMEVALAAGFKAQEMSFSGVGKSDQEIMLGIQHDIGCFNVESIPELEVINQLACGMGKTANIAFRVNPDIDAHTHKYITTGTAENKFGICIEALEPAIKHALTLPHIHLRGLHFHIGSQITTMRPFVMLCDTINSLLDKFEQQNIHFESINVGGGLGIDYTDPDSHPLPDFKSYFNTFKENLHYRPNQLVHFELGRSIVGECGTLIASVIYVKESRNKKFIILDAGMTELIRPALYDAHHLIQNLTAQGGEPCGVYDVVGPICESSDVFCRDCKLPVTRRGDLIAIRSAGAYGECMSSRYNMRRQPASVFVGSK